LDAGTAAVLPEGLRSELEQLEESGGVRHLNDLKDQIQVGMRTSAGALDIFQSPSGAMQLAAVAHVKTGQLFSVRPCVLCNAQADHVRLM